MANLEKKIISKGSVSHDKKGKVLRKHEDKGFSSSPSFKESIGIQKMMPSDVSKAFVGMSKGITKNIGNYESVRVDVWACIEVTKDDMDSSMKEVSSYLDELLDNELEELAEDLK